MAHEMRKILIEDTAGLVQDYRSGNSRFVKFGLRCGISLNRLPIDGRITHNPRETTERFSIGDPEYRGKFPTDKDAFYAAFERFTANAQFLALDGHAPDAGNFDMVKKCSEDYRWPTMFMDLVHRTRGAEYEQKLRLFFVGFTDDAEAMDYARRSDGVR